MKGGLRGWLGFSRAATAESLEELARFCAALTEQFGDRLPSYFGRSLATMAGWWAIALYVQFPVVSGARRFREADWQRASSLVADHMMARLFPDMPDEWREKRDLRDALQGQILGVCRLWIAAFGFPPEQATLTDTEQLTERLIALLSDDELDLRGRFDLPPDDDTEFDDEDDLTVLCRSYATFFEICARSRP